ncbi:hypothetical protein, partial [Burkholderia vietnamiensis]|uniref:hypothetical protein n=1 Tax=Burkholderia vietnamiensis TaxID=60552 RepID=UPI001CF3EE7B
NPATRRSFSLLSSGMVSTYSLKWTPACPGIHRDESASAMSAYDRIANPVHTSHSFVSMLDGGTLCDRDLGLIREHNRQPAVFSTGEDVAKRVNTTTRSWRARFEVGFMWV